MSFGSPQDPATWPTSPPPGPKPWSPAVIVGVIAGLMAVVVGIAALTDGSNGDGAATDTTETAPETETETEASESGADADDEAARPTPAEPTATPEPVIPSVTELAGAVVQIQLLLDGQPVCTGSGTIVESDGTVLTNSHVIAQSMFCPHDQIAVAITDVPELPPNLLFEADLLVDDPTLDLAVIRIARTLEGQPVTPDFPTVEIGDSDTLELGDRLRVIGYPGIGGETITFTEGTISGFVAIPGLGERSWLKTDATISGGNSGGLAVDDSGRIVGIPTIVGTGGTGQITDCRVIEDTNGDGRVDQDDSCIPVGGFINGIRPVNLALPLLAQAATATPIPIEAPQVAEPMAPERPFVLEPVWTLGVDANGFAAQPVNVVAAGVPELCLTWTYDDVPTGTPFEIVWFVDGVEEPDFGFTGTNQGDVSGGFFSCIFNDGPGLAEGLYEVGWIVADEPVFSHGVYVGGRPEILVEVVNETDTPLCVVQFAPSDTFTFGIARNNDVIAPGASFEVRFAAGRYDARVIDCDGALRFEDVEGTRLTEDSILTVN